MIVNCYKCKKEISLFDAITKKVKKPYVVTNEIIAKAIKGWLPLTQNNYTYERFCSSDCHEG